MPAAETLAIERENIRTARVRLLPTPELERILEELGDLRARIWNELNYERRKLFEDKEKGLMPEAMRETHKNVGRFYIPTTVNINRVNYRLYGLNNYNENQNVPAWDALGINMPTCVGRIINMTYALTAEYEAGNARNFGEVFTGARNYYVYIRTYWFARTPWVEWVEEIVFYGQTSLGRPTSS